MDDSEVTQAVTLNEADPSCSILLQQVNTEPNKQPYICLVPFSPYQQVKAEGFFFFFCKLSQSCLGLSTTRTV